MKAAIPVLPPCLAIFCFICNIFIPGLGTLISGVLCLCFGKPRFSTTDNSRNRLKSFVINIIIGIAQAFTIIFCLVGWGWSIWWGVIMYKLSKRQKRLKLVEKNQKEAAGTSNVNQNQADVEQG
ncbi:conserved hypothetical protein [Pediculus humanus corporis]|uniref:Protein SPEC3 n=1 Tax=Pediculus humanus subsp. corporis TaxID=121224 RepID=E0VC22_PEDHC|nr:uncharacterized protein Phum_PHUM077840 [Pediculus humanus corporis]EEB10928.1 conserved hypothetical protein [Pediculus humanus corporis]